MLWKEKAKYNIMAALKYAKKWAYKRNPDYLNFDNLGGDCTNFVSQCLFAGCQTMNFTPIYGWYYNNSYDRSPSWSGCKFLYEFLTTNKGIGPFGIDVDKEFAKLGDVVQFENNENKFSHTAIITSISDDKIFVAAHSNDAFNREIDSYDFKRVRYIHILGVNKS